jgi:hypothetical protein
VCCVTDLINCARHLRIESAITPIDATEINDDTAFYTDSKPDADSELDSESSEKGLLHFDDDEDYDSEDEEDYLDSCDECRRHQHNALTDSLPHPVVSG